MTKPISICVVLVLLASGVACHTISEDELVRRYGFARDSVRVELQIKGDHTYTETFSDAGKGSITSGTWKYWDSPRSLTLQDAWIPMVPLGSQSVHLEKANVTFHVDPCGKTVCLGVDDDNALQFVGR